MGNSISRNLEEKLIDGYKYQENIPIAGIVLNRFRSGDGNIFVVSDTYFSYKYSDKDYSQFLYKNKTYNKSQLVNQIVKDYVEDNPSVTFAQLREVFPKKLQGSYGVFDKLSIAEDIYNKSGRKRHYLKPSETINLIDGEVIATSTQWGSANILDFVESVGKLGFEIERR